MLRYVIRRLVVAVPLVLGVMTLVFVLLESAPGTAADRLLGTAPVPPEVRARVESAYGLDRPAPERYLRWLSSVALRGELGWSLSRGRPVRDALADALPPTLLLAGAALLLHLALGIALGVAAAARPRGRLDRALTAGGLAVYAMPTFWLGLMAVLLLSLTVPLFPASAMRSVGAEDWPWWRQALDVAWHLVLPAAVLGAASAAAMSRFVRAGVLESLGREFVRAARARGAGSRRVLWRHALRTALLPVINLAGLSLPVLVSGSLVVEYVFGWPGMGRLTYDAILGDDVPVVLATTLLATLAVVGGNLLADLAMALADPRIRLGGGERP